MLFLAERMAVVAGNSGQSLSWSTSSSFQGLRAPLSLQCKQRESNSRGNPPGSLSCLVLVHIRYLSPCNAVTIAHLPKSDKGDGNAREKAPSRHNLAWQKPSEDSISNGSMRSNKTQSGAVELEPIDYSALLSSKHSTLHRKTKESWRKVSTRSQVFVNQIGSKAQRRLRHLLFSESGESRPLTLLQDHSLWSFLNDAMRQRNWRGALDVFAAMKQVQGYQADVRIYTMMVRIMAKSKQPYRAFQLFEEMEGAGCGRDVSAFTALLDAYGRSGLLEQAVAVFEQMKTTPACRPNVYTYNCMINAYGQAQLWENIDALTREMDSLGVKPLDVTFNVLISTYGRGALYDRMERVFEQMQKAECKPDVFTFNTMIDAYGKGLRYAKMEYTYGRMLTSKCHPDILTYSSLMDAYRKAGLYEKVEETLETMCTAGCKPDVKAYSLLIDIYGKRGRLEKMEAMLKEMQSAGCRANVVTYTGILDAYGKAGLFEQMEEVWLSMNNMHLKPDSSAYVTMLSAYGKGGLFDKMEMVFEELKIVVNSMKIVGPKPGCAAYNALIDAYGKGKEIRKMERAFEEMQQSGHQPTVITYTALIDAYGKAGLYNKMERVNVMMKVNGCVPNVQTYGSRIDGYGRLGMVRKAEKVVEEMCAAGYHLDLVTYTCLIDAYSRAKDFQAMVAKFREMAAAGYEPNCVTIGVILSGLSSCRTWEEASDILHCIRVCPVFGVVGRVLEDGHESNGTILMKDLEVLFDRMQEAGPLSVLCDALIEVLWTFGWQKRAIEVLNLGRKRGAFLPQAQPQSTTEILLDLHMLSSSVAEVMLLAWLTDLKTEILDGTENAKEVCIVTGWGKRSKIEGDSPLKTAVSVRLDAMGSPFRVPRDNAGCFVATMKQVRNWLFSAKVGSHFEFENAAHPGPGYALKQCNHPNRADKSPDMLALIGF